MTGPGCTCTTVGAVEISRINMGKTDSSNVGTSTNNNSAYAAVVWLLRETETINNRMQARRSTTTQKYDLVWLLLEGFNIKINARNMHSIGIF